MGWLRETSSWRCGDCWARGHRYRSHRSGGLRAGWAAEFEAWSKRSLADREVVYVWADGIYVKAGLERDKAGAAGGAGRHARRNKGGVGPEIGLPRVGRVHGLRCYVT